VRSVSVRVEPTLEWSEEWISERGRALLARRRALARERIRGRSAPATAR
jgi:hypothetical protein